MIEEAPVVTNPDILGEMYIPPDIPGREAQINELVACLKQAMKNKKAHTRGSSGMPGDW